MNTAMLVILRREYLDITQNHCAAKLIEYFKHWTKWKLKNHRSDWIYQPLKNIHVDLMREHSLHVIRAAIALLEQKGILSKRNNPSNGQDKTYQYKLNLDVLHMLLEHRKRNSERSEYNAEQHTQITPQISDPQQQRAAVFEEVLEEPDWDRVEQEVSRWEENQSTTVTQCDGEPIETNLLGVPLKFAVLEPIDQEQDTPTNAPNLHEGNSSASADPDEKSQMVKQLGCQINSQLLTTLADFTVGEVKKAIAHYHQYKQRKAVTNIAGFIVECLRGKWWLTDNPTSPDGFNEWYNNARQQGLVQAAMMVDGVQMVYTSDGRWLTYESARHRSLESQN